VHKHMLAFRLHEYKHFAYICFHAARSPRHSRLSCATMPANESPPRCSKARLPTRWYAPGACVWQAEHKGTHE
jgi:hypothetical protein